MKKLLSLLFAASLIVGCSPKHKPSFEPTAPFKSYMKSVATLNIQGDQEDSFQPICSTTSINSEKHYWLTAAHCVVGKGEKFFILEDKAQPLLIDVPNDLAILNTNWKHLPAR